VNTAKEHGELIEVAWLFELLSPSTHLWIDSWNRSESLEMISAAEHALLRLIELVTNSGPFDRGALPALQGLNDGNSTLGTTIAHLYTWRAILLDVRGTIAFVNMCGITDANTAGMQKPGTEGFDLLGGSSREVCELPLFQHRCVVIIGSLNVARLMSHMLEPLPIELVCEASRRSSYVPKATPSNLVQIQLCRLVPPLYLGSDDAGNFRMCLAPRVQPARQHALQWAVSWS